MGGIFDNLIPSLLNPQICVSNEFLAEMRAIFISRDQKNRISSTFLQAISTTTVGVNNVLDDKS